MKATEEGSGERERILSEPGITHLTLVMPGSASSQSYGKQSVPGVNGPVNGPRPDPP